MGPITAALFVAVALECAPTVPRCLVQEPPGHCSVWVERVAGESVPVITDLQVSR